MGEYILIGSEVKPVVCYIKTLANEQKGVDGDQAPIEVF
jgi:hypothetical protein